jgi:UDP-GlcNAc:undecaprenyl-phosphate GlcNAc-1-phosphate transferase
MSQKPIKPEGLSSSQTILLALLIGVSLGSVGLLGLALMVLLSHQRFGVDRSSKHGISVRNTSRLGGLAIASFLLLVWALSYLKQVGQLSFNIVVPLDEFPTVFWPVLLIGVVGLADDIGVDIKPSFRLLMILVVGLVFFLLEPEALPNRLLEVLNIENTSGLFFLSAVSSVLLAGFVNAANISDGANGLLAGLCLVFFWVSWQLDGDSSLFYILIVLLCFWLINVLTGRILLGDLGAYALGALVVFEAFNLFDEHEVSLFFLASLLSYPCMELLRVMVVRRLRGQSLLSADDTHLHNLLNAKLRSSVRGNTLPNSLTGMLIVITTSLPGVLTFNLSLQGNTVINLAAFCVQAIIFLFLPYKLSKA